MDTVRGIAALVPRRLWSDDYGHGVRSCRGTILFADIAGFTRLTETARRRSGTRGIELLTTRINSIFSDLVEAAHATGGDILKFGGDAILVAYDDTSPDALSVSAAINGASAMERAILKHRRTTLRALSLHLGLAHGQWNECVAGEPGSRREHFVWGEAIANAMHTADSGGQRPRLHCPDLHSILGRHVSHFQRIGRNTYECSWDAPVFGTHSVAVETIPPATTHLSDFVSESLRNEAANAAFDPANSAEHRHVSTLFGFWKCSDVTRDPSQAATLFEHVHRVVHEIEIRCDGLWARSDPSGDKQKVLILFGAKESRPDDVDRALAAARTLQAEILSLKREFHFLRLGVGVATATVFAGFVGHATRREFTAMGDGVNLAARLAAKSSRNAILVDQKTRSESTRYRFRPAGTLTLKNVREPTVVFVPFAEVDASTKPAGDEIVEHPRALDECHRLWNSGSRSIWIIAQPGVNARKFTAQLLSRIDVNDSERRAIAFDSSDSTHPLGGTRRLYIMISQSQMPSVLLQEMFDASGQWAERSLKRLGIEATALAVAREMARHPMPQAMTVLDHVELLGELDRHVLDELTVQDGLRWVAIVHADNNRVSEQIKHASVHLGPLPEIELANVVSDLLAPARISKPLNRFLFERSHGLPALACALVTELIAQEAATRTNGRHPVWHLRSTDNVDLPNSLRAQYLQNVDRLPKRDQHVLRSIAVLGDTSPVESVQVLCYDLTDAELSESLSRLHRQELIRIESQTNDVRVAIEDSTCRQTVYETMSHQLRENWHKQAAAYWQSFANPDTARVGEHLFRARQPESARWLSTAARQSRRFWSLDRALRFTRWAILALQGRCNPEYRAVCPPLHDSSSVSQIQLYCDLAELLRLQGRHAESGRIENMLAKLAIKRGDKRVACSHRLAAARMELLAGHYRRSQSQVLQIQRAARSLNDAGIRAQSCYLLGETYRRSGRVELSFRALAEAESLASKSADRSLHADILNALGLLHWNCGRLDEARQCFEKSLRRLTRRTDHARRGQVANNLGLLTEEQGHLKTAERFYTSAFAVFDSAGIRRHRAYSLGNLANLHRHAARYERARNAYDEVETELLAMGEAHAAAYTVGNMGDLERDFGDFDAAHQRYEATLDFARKSGDEELKSECYSRMAHVHLLCGRLEHMPRLLKRAKESARLAESKEFNLYAELLLAELELAKGKSAAVARRLQAAHENSVSGGLVFYQLWTEYGLCRVHLHDGEIRTAAQRLKKAMGRARASRYRWWELRFAGLGADASMPPAVRAQCRARCVEIIADIRAGIGENKVCERFDRLPLVQGAESVATKVNLGSSPAWQE